MFSATDIVKDVLEAELNRDSQIFDKLYQDYSEKVYSLSRFKGLSMQDSQDIVQDTFAAVFAGYRSFENKSSIKTYIISIAKNKIADFYRKKYRHPEEELSGEMEAESQTDSVIEKTDIVNQMKNLDAEQQELLHMIFTQGLSYKEAAAVLNIPEGTIKSRMFVIRNKIKEGLGANYR